MELLERSKTPKTCHRRHALAGDDASASSVSPLGRGPQGASNEVLVRGTRGPRLSGQERGGGRASERQRASITMWDLAIWTYQAQKAHKDVLSSNAPSYSSLSSTARIGQVCALGGFVGGGGATRTYADDDALTVHEMVLRMTGGERALIIGSAKTATQPDWSPLIPEYRFVPVPGRKGRLYKGIYDRSGNEIGCEVTEQGFSPRRASAAVAHARATWGAWYSALWVLRDALLARGELRRWAITGVGVEAEPWRVV